jgi:hypothetical protein
MIPPIGAEVKPLGLEASGSRPALFSSQRGCGLQSAVYSRCQHEEEGSKGFSKFDRMYCLKNRDVRFFLIRMS